LVKKKLPLIYFKLPFIDDYLPFGFYNFGYISPSNGAINTEIRH